MSNNRNRLTLRPKKEFFTKEELTSYIENQINILKDLNPILENTYLIKIESEALDSWKHYYASIDCFMEDASNLLSFPNMFIWPKVVNDRIQVYIALQTQNIRQGKKFLEGFALEYLWPLQNSNFKVEQIKNLSVVMDHLLSIKNKVDKSKVNLTKYSKKYEMIENLFEERDTISEVKQKLYKQLNKINKFKKKYQGGK